jgi:hypothetical protein
MYDLGGCSFCLCFDPADGYAGVNGSRVLLDYYRLRRACLSAPHSDGEGDHAVNNRLIIP